MESSRIRPRSRFREKSAEFARFLLLAAAAAWLLRPFATSRLIGSGDALWYANILADYVTQLRHGVFPIFAGQSEFAFNGAVFPLRVCPFYQHLAGLLDLLTLQRLGFFALQHLCVIVCGAAGIFGSYLTLCAIAPSRRWSACFLAILYLSCPGVLATIYTQDLYMTWMTVPFVPLAVYGIVRTFRQDDIRSQFWLAAPLAALWMAHTPIALWVSLLVLASQPIRLLFVHRSLPSISRAALGAAIFAVLAQYPFVSVASLHSTAIASPVAASLLTPKGIVSNVRDAFPGILLPLSKNAGKLSDLQLGYGLWIVFAMATIGFLRRPTWLLASLVGFSALLLLLLIPIPGLTDSLWSHLPAQLERITLYWPMQRFYLILAALLPAAFLLSVGQVGTVGQVADLARSRLILGILLAFACAWSLWESRQFIHAGQKRTASSEYSALVQRPENLTLMDHSYGLFAALPPYFSNGVMDPQAETRLIGSQNQRSRFRKKSDGTIIAAGTFTGAIDPNPGILDLTRTLRLEFGKRYELEFEFTNHDYTGILQLVGHSLFREYVLPESGEPLAFGAEPANSHIIPLWTTNPVGDEVSLRFIPTSPGATPASFVKFSRFELREIIPSRQPVTVTSLIPFRADVRTDAPGLLETPRMFMPGYAAKVDGQAVEALRLPSGLVAIPITASSRDVELRFVGTFLLRASYWLFLVAWACTVAAFFIVAAFVRTRTPSPSCLNA